MSIVGDGGMLYLMGAPQKGTLQVKWGNNPEQRCKVNYDLGELPQADNTNNLGANIVQQTLDCQPLACVSAPQPVPPGLAAIVTTDAMATATAADAKADAE